MILLACVDDNYGLAFNGRRQSRDRAVSADMLSLAGEKALWIEPGSEKLFEAAGDGREKVLRIEPDCLEQAGIGEYCFVESLAGGGTAWRERVEKLALYKWNRKYPADTFLEWDFEGWELEERREFAGYSHERITREIYRKRRSE